MNKLKNIKMFEQFLSESNDSAIKDALEIARIELQKFTETYPEDEDVKAILGSIEHAQAEGTHVNAMRDTLQEAYDELVKWYKSFPEDEDLPGILKTIEAALGLEPFDIEDTI